jgi:hypothetical protein
MSASAGEVGALATVFGWPDGVTTIYSPIPTAAGGPLVGAQAGNGWKSYGVADFNTLSAGGQATTQTTGGFSQGWIGGQAYWKQEITISSPSVPVGTQGLVDFTLFFEGLLEASASPPAYTAFGSGIGYRWDVGPVAGAPDYSQSGFENRSILVGFDYLDATGTDFLNSPRNHTLIFGYGQPFTLKLMITTSSKPWRHRASKARVELRSTGWNGFKNYRLRHTDIPVNDAVVTSPSGFNYGDSSTTTYSQWAGLYQLDTISPQADSNNNGLSNLLEYALGRNPLDADNGAPVTPGVVTIGAEQFNSMTFTRPALGGRPGDIIYQPERSIGLDGWGTGGLETTVSPANSQTETVTVRSTQPMTGQNSEFLRLGVKTAP